MNRIALVIIAVAAPLFVRAFEPASITMTNVRSEGVVSASSDVFYRGNALALTNCVMFSGTSTTGARQDLTGLTVKVSWGDNVLATQVATGSVTTATSGVWNASLTLRTNEAVKTFIEVSITDGTNTFVYPQKFIETKSKL